MWELRPATDGLPVVMGGLRGKEPWDAGKDLGIRGEGRTIKGV